MKQHRLGGAEAVSWSGLVERLALQDPPQLRCEIGNRRLDGPAVEIVVIPLPAEAIALHELECGLGIVEPAEDRADLLAVVIVIFGVSVRRPALVCRMYPSFSGLLPGRSAVAWL